MILDSWLLNPSALFWENWSYKSRDILITVANILVYSNGMANQEMTGKCVVSQSRVGRKTPPFKFLPNCKNFHYCLGSKIMWVINHVAMGWSRSVCGRSNMGTFCLCSHNTIAFFAVYGDQGLTVLKWAPRVSLILQHSIPRPWVLTREGMWEMKVG